MRTTSFGVMVVGATVLTLGCFFIRRSRSPFRFCCVFELKFFSPGRLPCGGHYKLHGRLRERLRKGLGCGLLGGVVVVMTARPLGRRDFTPRPGPATRQRRHPPCDSGAACWPVASHFWLCSGASFARTAFASFHITQQS